MPYRSCKRASCWSEGPSLLLRSPVRPSHLLSLLQAKAVSALRALTDTALSRLARDLVTSFVYSNDVVARLSLGTIRDIRNAAHLLCEAQESAGGQTEGEGYVAVTNRAKAFKAGKNQTPEEMEWVCFLTLSLLYLSDHRFDSSSR